MKPYPVIFTLILFSINAHSQHQIEYKVSALGNLVYQLDCMAKVARFRCSQQDFINLWQTELPSNDKDSEMLALWQQTRIELDQTLELAEESEIAMPTSANFPRNANNTLNLLKKIRIMAFAAKTQSAYFEVIGGLLSPWRAEQEKRVLNHFMPRFKIWFAQQSPTLNQFVKEANALTETTGINTLLTAMRIFYRSELPADMTLPVYLIAHPESKAATSGLVFNQNSLIEVLKGEQAKDRLAVVIHEISHFYHESADMDWHLQVMQQFTAANSATGVSGYYLFNEAMAAAIGNGLLEERLQDQANFAKYLNYPLSFYANSGIDISAKAALALVKSYINNNKAMDSAFLTELDQQWSVALAKIKNSPKQRLRHVGLLVLDESYQQTIDPIFGMIRPSSAQIIDTSDGVNEHHDFLQKFHRLDAIILAKNWQQLEPFNIEGLTVDERKPIQIIKNKYGTARVIFVAQTEKEITAQLQKLLQQNTF